MALPLEGPRTLSTPFYDYELRFPTWNVPCTLPPTTSTWVEDLRLQLEQARCETETASLSATAVAVPAGKRRVLVVLVRRQGDPNVAAKFQRWKQEVQLRQSSASTVGRFLRREGSFLRRGKDEKYIFSAEGPPVTITQGHIMGRKPHTEELVAHQDGVRSLEEAHD